MKKLLLLTILFASALATLGNVGTSLPFTSSVTIDWMVYVQLPSTNSFSTNHPSKGVTNIVITTKLSYSSSNFANVQLLKLLENSFNTSFPAGTRLATDGHALFVVDKTGTNVVLNIASVTSVEFEAYVVKYNAMETERLTSAAPTYSQTYGYAPEISYVVLRYDDSSLTTADGTHSVFNFDGLSTGQISGTVPSGSAGTMQESFTLPGAGSGTIRGKPVVLGGSVKGNSAGAEVP